MQASSAHLPDHGSLGLCSLQTRAAYQVTREFEEYIALKNSAGKVTYANMSSIGRL